MPGYGTAIDWPRWQPQWRTRIHVPRDRGDQPAEICGRSGTASSGTIWSPARRFPRTGPHLRRRRSTRTGPSSSSSRSPRSGPRKRSTGNPTSCTRTTPTPARRSTGSRRRGDGNQFFRIGRLRLHDPQPALRRPGRRPHLADYGLCRAPTLLSALPRPTTATRSWAWAPGRRDPDDRLSRPTRAKSSRSKAAAAWTACSGSGRDRLFGILNGIDTDLWNPLTDTRIGERFGLATARPPAGQQGVPCKRRPA